MSKAVAYALLTTAFVLFFVFSPIQPHDHNDRLAFIGRRFGYRYSVPTFDPFVLKMNRVTEEKKSGSIKTRTNTNDLEKDSYDTEDVEDEYDFFSENGRLNITSRLIYLFPLIDNEPKDGVLSLNELDNWNVELAVDRLSYTTQKQIELSDRDGDGEISFYEYLPQFSKQDIGRIRTRMDDDNDGKLNLDEFLENTYRTYKSYAEFEDDGDGTDFPSAEETFVELDTNKDKLLEVEELKPIFSYLHPGEISYAKYYSRHLIHEADDNRDGNLTLDEMLNHEYIFYNTVYNDVDDDDYDFRDEL
ncbi:calcium-binding EF hand family protein [Citrus sinensis]|uniref:Calcium-binding EF hand family protein n=1 Tax=Citrus sinensis TaxID=2711 RepID=A0ACB8M3G0_CITSI|nr:calcium-binding EF hand family protein [Citrus sinensis]